MNAGVTFLQLLHEWYLSVRNVLIFYMATKIAITFLKMADVSGVIGMEIQVNLFQI